MDGFHDMGGRQGFGPVHKQDDPFQEEWEVKVSAIHAALAKQRLFNMDEYRHAIERMDARHYVKASYFERVFTAVATLCVERGVFTHAELGAITGEAVQLSRSSAAGRKAGLNLPDLHLGDMVRVKAEFIAGHIRLPAYIRGKVGRIVDISPEYPFPDAAAHGIASPMQRTFDVCFKSTDLWREGADSAELHVGVFHSYLTKVDDNAAACLTDELTCNPYPR